MRLIKIECYKVWHNKLFLLCTFCLLCVHLFFLYQTVERNLGSIDSESYQTMLEHLAPLSLEEQGEFLSDAQNQIDGLWIVSNYYNAIANSGKDAEYALAAYKQENSDVFLQYEQCYVTHQYFLYTDEIATDYQLINRVSAEYNQVANYDLFLKSVAQKADLLQDVSVFIQSNNTYDQKVVAKTASAYERLQAIVIQYTPSLGIEIALTHTLTDIWLLVAMFLLSFVMIWQEYDAGLLHLSFTLPAGRMQIALAKIIAFIVNMLLLVSLFYGVNLLYCKFTLGMGVLSSSIQSVAAFSRSPLSVSIFEYVVIFGVVKWIGMCALGLFVMFISVRIPRLLVSWSVSLSFILAEFIVYLLVNATGVWQWLRYINIIGFLQMNVILAEYKLLYWRGNALVLSNAVACTLAILSSFFLFCFLYYYCYGTIGTVTAYRSVKRKVLKTQSTTVFMQEFYKMFVLQGAIVIVCCFCILITFQALQKTRYMDASEIYRTYYLTELSQRTREDALLWFEAQSFEFEPLEQARNEVADGTLAPEFLAAYTALMQKESVYLQILYTEVAYVEHATDVTFINPDPYFELFDTKQTSIMRNIYLLGLFLALSVSGIFCIEIQSAMQLQLRCTARGGHHLLLCKFVQVGIACFVMWICVVGNQIAWVNREFSLGNIMKSAKSLSLFYNIPAQINIQMVVCLWAFFWALGIFFLGFLFATIGALVRNWMYALFVNISIGVIPCLLAENGISVLRWCSIYPIVNSIIFTANGYHCMVFLLSIAAMICIIGCYYFCFLRYVQPSQ